MVSLVTLSYMIYVPIISFNWSFKVNMKVLNLTSLHDGHAHHLFLLYFVMQHDTPRFENNQLRLYVSQVLHEHVVPW